jgi:hypothetical protein
MLLCLAGCGRMGFGEGADAAAVVPDGVEVQLRADGPPAIDADPATPDAQIGSGSYAVAESVMPYTSPAGATVVPGFAEGADDENYPLALPFPFVLYGVTYDSITISVNGFVGFGAPVTAAESYENDCPIDATTPDAMIAVFWDDLFASTMFDPRASISTLVEGAPPDRRFTIEWRDLDAWYQQGMSYWGQKLRVTHKLVLHEDGVFDLHYGPRTPPEHDDEDCGIDRHRGCSATIGLEASGSGAARTFQCGTAAGPVDPFKLVDEGWLLTFTPQ